MQKWGEKKREMCLYSLERNYKDKDKKRLGMPASEHRKHHKVFPTKFKLNSLNLF